jgi:hypothetical protein
MRRRFTPLFSLRRRCSYAVFAAPLTPLMLAAALFFAMLLPCCFLMPFYADSHADIAIIFRFHFRAAMSAYAIIFRR